MPDFKKIALEIISSALSQAYEEGRRAERERCIRIVRADETCMIFQDFGMQSALFQKGENIIAAISPEAANTQSPDEEPHRGDTGTAEQREASLTQKITQEDGNG